MTFLEIVRNRMFWLLDNIKGGRVKTYYKALRYIEGKGGVPDEKIYGYQRKYLKKLLIHAQKTVPIYKSNISINIEEWPVTNKMTYRENYSRCISSKYNESSLIKMATSGSTGTPFVCYQDHLKKKHVNAETLFYNGQVGYKIGRRIIYLRSVVSEVQKSPLQQFFQNIYLLDCNDLSDEGIKEKLKTIASLSRGCGAMVMGYASTFEAFRKYFERYGFEDVESAEVFGIVSGSEMLYDKTRESMEKAFKCKCVSRYANEENGFLGQDSDVNNVFYHNRADYYFEILKLDQDAPADDGEIGRIVVTDLFNYAMPMIRYDTGDIGAFVKRPGMERRVIGSFGGRKVDSVTDTRGCLVSPHAITNLMWRYQNIKQYQFIQTDAGRYRMIINLLFDELDEEKLIHDLKNILGEDADIAIQYTEDIPVLTSGKRRYIVNEMFMR